MAAKVRRNDTVEVISGKDKGQRGEVRQVFTKTSRVLVTGVNMVKKHRRARSMTEPSEVLDIEAPLHVSNVKVVCPACEGATRVGFRVVADGRKVRFCKTCDEPID
jgi:large subunit ribosomal protein L24